MDKKGMIILGAVVVLLIIGAIIFAMVNKNGESKSKLEEVTSAEDLQKLISKVYEGVKEEDLLPSLETSIVETSEKDTVTMLTGLENGEELEYLVVSQPLMSSQAYSFVLAKVKAGTNANEVAKKMSEQVDTRRWICVEAEKLYATNSGDVVCLIMADNDKAQTIYNSFKELAGGTGKEYEKTATVEELELGPDAN